MSNQESKKVQDELDELNRTAAESIEIANQALKSIQQWRAGNTEKPKDCLEKSTVQKQQSRPLDMFGLDTAYWIRASFQYK
jgi:hypothetical protein